MALPKKGYLPGIYRFVSGTVDAAGRYLPFDFSITNIPKDGYVPGIYQLTQVTIDAEGNTDVAEDAVGIVAAVEVTVDGAGDLSVTDIPQEGYVSGVYRVTTSTNIGDFHTFRIVQEAGTGNYCLYRDTELLNDSVVGYDYVTDYLNVGDVSTGHTGASVDIDYIGYTSGPWAPVPEPTTLALLICGALMMLIRRR